MREFIKPNPTGPAALIKPTFTADEVKTYTQNAKVNSLPPVNSIVKYVEERIFGVGARPGIVRILIDGFPCEAARWLYFKEAVKQYWSPSDKSVLIALQANSETAKERFEKRGRAGEEFDQKFEEHEKSIDTIIEAMEDDGMTVIELSVNHGRSAEELVDDFEAMSAWIRAVVQRGDGSTSGDEDEGDVSRSMP